MIKHLYYIMAPVLAAGAFAMVLVGDMEKAAFAMLAAIYFEIGAMGK